ncbi:AraC family transcriptional regulator [Marivirga salinae]|uniref:AraC family transcriptional regulator n=1 Tax=Marivirga salinarum TaxID=3059078 RepID=A0AA49GBM0_9BACT|nr:AraC family transcriptional regulator [Marivirga sp. BDSF4-3]WKK74740.2 AraC family transcriptional regulator [Marivirga sp. BDSF4-3]
MQLNPIHIALLSPIAKEKLYIKYMVSLRCKLMVQEELKKLNVKHLVVELGAVELLQDITQEQREALKHNLLKSGLELLDNKKSILVEKIKNSIIEMIHFTDDEPKANYSEYLSKKLEYDYTYLSNLFSEVKGITIQQFIIIHKIEKAKELILYEELNTSEIAYRLHYSSVAHFSNQFKKITGLTPSFYRKLKQKRLGNLEDV